MTALVHASHFPKEYNNYHGNAAPDVLYKKGVLKNFALFTRKNLCWRLFLITLRALACNFIKKRLRRRCFPVNIANFLRTPILKNICERLHPNSLTQPIIN